MGADWKFSAKEIASFLNIAKRTVTRRAADESWAYIEEQVRGGKIRKYPLAGLPADVQEAYIKKEGVNPDLLPALKSSAVEAMIRIYKGEDELFRTPMQDALKPSGGYDPERAVSEHDLQNPRIRKILAILREVESPARGWEKGKRKWIELLAKKHCVRWQSIYRWMKKYEKKGIAGLRHTKSYKNQVRRWSPEAVDFFVSLCGKREHRGANRKDLYDILALEAARRGWKIGGYDSAVWWFERKWNPLMNAMQRGGMRALDNLLPPILRDYSDLAPFEILVGDQHRFDRWVMDEETGEVYRPEGYLWQDLRTRTIYGAAVDRKYDAWLIGLALRLGVSTYGAFGSIYTDNGRPEISRFITSVLANLRGMGMEWDFTIDTPADITDHDGDEVQPCVLMPGTHKKAIVKNAKAKMIEGTFCRIEQIMSSRMLLPGQTKKLTDDIHWQDTDHNEAMKLAQQGKLLTNREFIIALFTAINYYNTEKHHTGVLREWSWKPKPKTATPRDCLTACYNEGWRPKMISPEAADLIFLARATRVVDRGRIRLENEQYEADALLELHGERLDVRYNPMILDEAHIFRGGAYLCTARPVEMSSMIDRELASQKIAQKRERRKKFAEEFRRISSIAPDFRQYSTVPEAERVAALVGAERKKRALENREFARPISEQEITAHIEKMEAGMALPSRHAKPLPERPEFFIDELVRMEWIAKYMRAGGELAAEDEQFRRGYLATLTADQKEFWEYQMARG